MKSMEFATAGQAFIRVLEDRVRRLGLVLGEEPARVTDADLRAALKSGNRAKTAIEGAVLACGKFDQKFAVADAKSPRKIVISKVETALAGWNGDAEAMASAILSLVGKQSSENSADKSAEDGAFEPRPREVDLAKLGGSESRELPREASEIRPPAPDFPRSAKASRAATPRRQKMVDPMIAELRGRAGDGRAESREPGGAGGRTLDAPPAEGGGPKRE
jgi:hypothetical protein